MSKYKLPDDRDKPDSPFYRAAVYTLFFLFGCLFWFLLGMLSVYVY